MTDLTTDWNEFSPKLVEEKGKDAPTPDMYRASKTLAERAFWKWIEDNKPSWDGATVNPPMVFGPILQQISSVSDLNTSNGKYWASHATDISQLVQLVDPEPLGQRVLGLCAIQLGRRPRW